MQKVGEFLEKKTGSDVSRGKIGFVHLPGRFGVGLVGVSNYIDANVRSITID